MSAEPETIAPTSGPKKRLKIRWAGPGVIMAVSGIGASDVIAATVGGATYGTSLLWALVLGTFFKLVLTEGLARWQLATGTTILEGQSRHLPRWVLVIFFLYLVLWSIAVSGALISGCGLAVQNMEWALDERNRIALRSAIAHNQRTTNAVLIVVLLLFLAVVAWEIPSLFY